MRLPVAVALIPKLSGLTDVRRQLMKSQLAMNPLPQMVAKFGDRLEEANEVLDFLGEVVAMTVDPIPQDQPAN